MELVAMSRSVPEWIGKNSDSRIPNRIRLRIFDKFNGVCQCGCTRKIMPGEAWDADHIVALINGGEHREFNLRPLLREHHRTKTRADVREKSRTYKRRASHVGLRKSKRPSFATNRDGPFRKKLSGEVIPR
jgi:5-methylcytosine-specific restriction endonuclease McrA